nr:penicillopepsin-3 [Quercus suber]
MSSIQTMAAVLALSSMVTAAPTQIFGRSQFKVSQVASNQTVFKSGPLHMMKTYNKYASVGAVAPARVVAAAADAEQSGTATASPEQYDSAYLIPVQVGSNTLNLDLDTGSSDLPSEDQGSHNLYDTSSGTQEQGQSWTISYGDGSGASGIVFADQVVVGGVTATSQAVEAATSVSSSFVSGQEDGLIGMAFSSINTVTPNQATTFFDTVMSSLQSPLFTADLKYQSAGEYTFGYIDSSKYTGDITYNQVDNSQGFWGFTAGSSGTSADSLSNDIGSAIADTGTSLLYIPDANVQDYYSNIDGAQNSNDYGGWVFSCDATVPDFYVSIGGATYSIPGQYINYTPNGDGTCFGGIQSNSGIGQTIMGDIFLKAVYVVFSETDGAGSPTIGFASQS